MEAIETAALMEKTMAPETASGPRLGEKAASTQLTLPGTKEERRVAFPKETNVAKMLAAHAKYRWVNLAANYKVKVDDITVVVVGFS